MKYHELKSKIIKSASQSKTPVLCEFCLTSNCNFSCPMCYVRNNINTLDTDTWTSIFDAAIKAGMIFANLTGGEIFLRDDFNYLYEYLYDRGVKITLFTNGSILKEETLELLKLKKPHFIAITLYGYDYESYNFFTKNQTGFNSVINNIKRLKNNNINIILRTIPLLNVYINLDRYISLAKSLDEPLYYSKYITKSNVKNDSNPRLTSEELLDFEIRLNTAFGFTKNDSSLEDTYSSCYALQSALYINSLGEMLPCAYATRPKASILDKDFYQTFLELGKEFTDLESKNPCNNCKYLNNCLTCFARRESEEDCTQCSDYLKSLAIEESKYYNIAGNTYYIDYKYQGYLNNNIEKYQTKSLQSPIYKIRTKIVNDFVLPNKEPNIAINTRRIYKFSNKEIMYSLDESNNVKYSFQTKGKYQEFDISINESNVKNASELEYIFMGIAFLNVSTLNNQIPIHGSALSYNGESIILSAPSKTGKSTLARNFLKVYNGFEIFNDDKPIIYLKDKKLVCAGTPFCGKDAINKNRVYPLKTIVFLEQGLKDEIFEIDTKEKLKLFMKNTFRPRDKDLWENIANLTDVIVKNIRMYKATVTDSLDAPKVIYRHLYGGELDES